MLFLPIGHDQTIRRFPWLTVAIMALCALLQLYRTAFEPSSRDLADAIGDRDGKAEIVRVKSLPPVDETEETPPPLAANDPDVLALRAAEARLHELEGRSLVHRFGYRPKSGASPNLFLCAFVHGGWLHLAGNLLFLWLCGCNLEDRWGRVTFGLVYSVSAIVASIGYAIAHRGSDVPLVGASGAIAGAMGAFLVCFHTASIRYWWWWWFKTGTVYLPAYVAFPVWFLSQLAQSFLEVSGYDEVAYSAHVGGFVCGVAATLTIRFSGLEKRLRNDEEEDDEIAVAPPQPMPMPVPIAPPPELMPVSAVPEPAPWPPPIIPSDDPEPELPAQTVPFETAFDDTSRFLLLAEQSRWNDALALYDSMGDRPLSDRAYSVVVRATLETNNLQRCVRIAQKMANHYPASPLLPRAVWDVANAQERGGRP